MRIKIIGAGLAGAEAAFQAAKRGLEVVLYEMKPKAFSPAHKSPNFAEVVCSNSFKSDDPSTASGLLKEELRLLGSRLIEIAEETRVPAGSALAVDRELFSKRVTEELLKLRNVTVKTETVADLEAGRDEILIVATGPLTHESLLPALKKICGEFLYFFDAVAPIVTAESVDMEHAFVGGRYGKGDDYVNCPMTKDEFLRFWEELTAAETAPLKDFENNVFEGCMPVEIMAKRGTDTIRFGPLKPVGLFDPKTSSRPYAVLQLRKENVSGGLYNLVGMQTNLTFGGQKRVFSLIPALKNAEFVRYGVMHRNTFIDAPRLLNRHFQLKSGPKIFFAGQLAGVEGYVESIAAGLVTGRNAADLSAGKPLTEFENKTMIGAIADYISSPNNNFQPMNANFGILPPLTEKFFDKRQKKAAYGKRALVSLENTLKGE